MPAIVWNDERMSLGVDEIDAQHQKMIKMFNTLYDSFHSGDVREGLQEALVGLAEYVNTHFRDEEALMKRINYRHYDEHCLRHQELRDRVAAKLRRLKQGQEVGVLEMLNFMKDWIIEHIEVEDKKIGRAVAAKTINQPSPAQ